MIFQQSVKTLKKFAPYLNRCEEFTDAWYFYYNDEEDCTQGDYPGVVVLKSNGAFIRPAQFFWSASKESRPTGIILTV